MAWIFAQSYGPVSGWSQASPRARSTALPLLATCLDGAGRVMATTVTRRSEFYAFLSLSGAGKSTTTRIVRSG